MEEQLTQQTPEEEAPAQTYKGEETPNAVPGDEETEHSETEAEEEHEVDYATLAAEDLAQIKKLDPSYAPAAHLSERPFARRFAELRDLGLSVSEALAAAAPRFEGRNGKSHLRTLAPRGSRGTAGSLDRAQMKEAKLLFSGLSEAEINALYRRVSQKNND